MMSEGSTGEIFPTLYYQRDHDDLEQMNKALLELILEQERAHDGEAIKRVSLVGGYRSNREFLQQDHWAIKALIDIIKADLASYSEILARRETVSEDVRIDLSDIDLWGWSLVLREGDMVAPHLHKRCNVVGAYYVYSDTLSGEAPALSSKGNHAGDIVLCDPRTRAYAMPLDGQQLTVSLPNQHSRMILFPSYVEHYVLPFRGPGKRVSIAFNIRFQR